MTGMEDAIIAALSGGGTPALLLAALYWLKTRVDRIEDKLDAHCAGQPCPPARKGNARTRHAHRDG